MPSKPAVCEWIGLEDALRRFALHDTGTQSAGHIRPFHWYVACRLVVEGGFDPDDITPRPPFVVHSGHKGKVLECDPARAGGGERTLLGGLKTKVVDVVVTRNGIGPVVAVSMKGTSGAFRNLTNRMEEAVGDCTNLHIAYPALVYGFFQVIRANRGGPDVAPNDVALHANGEATDAISRYHDILTRLAGRADVRDDVTKYEAVALALVAPDPPSPGMLIRTFPGEGSPLLLDGFFDKLYRQYDQRFVFAAPGLEPTTRRLAWSPDSPALADARAAGYEPRVAGDG
jgi:hypothetical protein